MSIDGHCKLGILTPGAARNRGFGRVVRRISLGDSCHSKLQMCRTPIGETLCAILHLSVGSTALTGPTISASMVGFDERFFLCGSDTLTKGLLTYYCTN